MVYAPNRAPQEAQEAEFVPATEPVGIEVQMPAELYNPFQQFLAKHPDWNYDRVLSNALALFLMQNTENESGSSCGVEGENLASYRAVSQIYLKTLFGSQETQRETQEVQHG